MLDDEARRALEEEAIALVSLSNPTPRFLAERMTSATTDGSGDNEALAFAPPRRQYEQHQHQQHQQQSSSSGNAIHPMLQVKANLIARRDRKLGGATPARKLRIKASVDSNPAAVTSGEDAGENGAFLSMEVYVNGERSGAAGDGGDLKLAPHSNRSSSNSSSTQPAKRATSHSSSSDELYAQNPAVSEEQQQLDALNGNISMKSLLVTLKKRKLSPDADAAAAAAKVLPSFRDVFESRDHQALGSQALNVSGSSSAGTAATMTPGASPTPATVLSSAELKCKYRTGKCSNARALKSCGDYHNLCNYHRLRANANQRKLDRKKKVQRQTTTTASGTALSSAVSSPQPGAAAASSSSSSPASVSAAAALCAPSAAAAAALVAMPTSVPPMLFHHQQQQQQQQQRFEAAASLFSSSQRARLAHQSQSQQEAGSSNSLRVKQEDRCM